MKIIKLIKIKKKNRYNIADYNLCLVKKSSHRKFVYEKLGKLSKKNKLIRVNVFRLCFWVSKNVAFSGNVTYLLLKNGIFNHFKKKNKNTKKVKNEN